MDDKKARELTNQKLKELGINKDLDQVYNEYCDGNKTKSYKIIEKYNFDRGILFGGTANPFHIYNQYFYQKQI